MTLSAFYFLHPRGEAIALSNGHLPQDVLLCPAWKKRVSKLQKFLGVLGRVRACGSTPAPDVGFCERKDPETLFQRVVNNPHLSEIALRRLFQSGSEPLLAHVSKGFNVLFWLRQSLWELHTDVPA